MSFTRKGAQSAPPYLRSGDCMLREEFHRLYTQMPDDYRAELMGGIVFEPSPVSYAHGEHHSQLNHLLRMYSIGTPHVGLTDNASVFLSDEDELQPDLTLRLSEKFGGKSVLNKKGFIVGAPELVAEIAYSSRAIDLHFKKSRYKLAGVTEYIVVCLEPKRFYWFDLNAGTELEAKRGITRSAVFPGLWLHGEALLELDDLAADDILNRGLKSQEHKRFKLKLDHV